MKRLLLSAGISLAAAAAAQAQQGPAAALGLPRASLGLPQPVREREAPPPLPTSILPTRAEISQPLSPPAPLRAGPLVTPYNIHQTVDPKPMPMPNSPGIDEGKKESLPPPALTPPIEQINPPFGQGPVYSSVVSPEEAMIGGPELSTLPYNTGAGDRLRLSAEYLMWWTSGMNVPPLVTTGPNAGNGALTAPGTNILFGYGDIGPRLHSGMRTGFEYFFGPCCNWGVDGHWFFLAQQGASRGFQSSASGDPLLARPFYSLNFGAPSSELVAFPGVYSGGIAIGNSTSLWGADLNARRKFYRGCNSYIDGIVGYRYVNLQESLTIMERSAQIAPGTPGVPVLSGMAFDRFETSNKFNGAQIGTAMGTTAGRWSFDLRSTIAFGVTSSSVDISGAQNVTFVDGTSAVTPGGLLALNSNIGRHYHDSFAVVPELTFNIGYNITQKCRVFVGYNLLYWSNVLRPGNQIDGALDENRIPNFPVAPTVAAARPAVPFQGRDFFAQGMNFGLMFSW